MYAMENPQEAFSRRRQVRGRSRDRSQGSANSPAESLCRRTSLVSPSRRVFPRKALLQNERKSAVIADYFIPESRNDRRDFGARRYTAALVQAYHTARGSVADCRPGHCFVAFCFARFPATTPTAPRSSAAFESFRASLQRSSLGDRYRFPLTLCPTASSVEASGWSSFRVSHLENFAGPDALRAPRGATRESSAGSNQLPFARPRF